MSATARRRARGRASTAASVAALTCVGALAGVPMTGIVDGPAPIAVAAVTAVAATLAMCAAGVWTDRRNHRRWGRLATLAVAGAGGAVAVAIAVAGVWPGPDGSRRSPLTGALAGAFAGATEGWSAVITSPVPADAEPVILVPLAVLVWSATGAGVALAIRTRARVAPLLPGTAAIVSTSIAAGAQQSSAVVVGLGLAAATAVSLAATTRPPGVVRDQSPASRASTRRSTIAIIVGAAVVMSAVGIAVGPRLTFGRDEAPFDPRDLFDPPVVAQGAVNPIELAASWLDRDDVVMFTVRADEPLETRLLVLDSFDGARWSATATYQPTGTVLPETRRDGVEVREVAAEFTIDQLQGPWLPSIADPIRVDGVRVLVDPIGRTLIAAGDLPTSYVIEAAEPVFDAALRNRMQTLPVAHDEQSGAASAALLDPPDWVREMATEATGSTTTPYLQAVRLEHYIRTNFGLSEEPVAGHSYGQLSRSLLEGEDGAASSEQLASAFAVVGRILGLPTRVVVGFQAGDEIAPGIYEVRASHVKVWPEVRFTQVGWVPFDPTPTAIGSGASGGDLGTGVGVGDEGEVSDIVPEPPDGDPIGPDDQRLPDALDQTPEPAGQRSDVVDPVAPSEMSDDGGRTWQTAIVAALAVIVILLTPLAAIVVVKRRSTARRRGRTAEADRVLGAWDDVRDRLTEVGDDRSASLTVEEIVERSSGRTGALTGLYRPVNKALYGHEAVTGDDAELAWRARDRFVDTCRRDSTLPQRVRWAVDPRPIVQSVRTRERPRQPRR